MRRTLEREAFTALSLLAIAACAMASCATTNVLVQAPEEFWATIEKLLMAMWDDVSSLLILLGL